MKGIVRKIFAAIMVVAMLVTVVQVQPMEASAAKRYNPYGKYSKSIYGDKYTLLIDNINDNVILDIYPKGNPGAPFLSADIKRVKGKKNVYKSKRIYDPIGEGKYKSKDVGMTITVYKKKVKIKLTGKYWQEIFGGVGSNMGGIWKRSK